MKAVFDDEDVTVSSANRDLWGKNSNSIVGQDLGGRYCISIKVYLIVNKWIKITGIPPTKILMLSTSNNELKASF
jgi:hypothetical protein